MLRPRIIPVLLLQQGGLVKTTRFGRPRYIGDPINTMRIFNDLGADEVILLDIDATREGRSIEVNVVRDVGEEAEVPVAVGGGLRTLDAIRAVIGAGAEKVVLGTIAAERPSFVREAADAHGSSAIVVCIDVVQTPQGVRQVHVRNATSKTRFTPLEMALEMERQGAGELVVQSVDRDGVMNGYDIPLIRSIADAVSIPVVALGGAGHLDDLSVAFRDGNAHGLAAGSLFVFQGPKKGVLVSYPPPAHLIRG